MTNSQWKIRRVLYMPEGFEWRVSQFDGIYPTANKEGFFSEADAQALADKLNGVE